MRDLSRLFRPKSIAVVGGGAWCAQVVGQSRRLGFTGAIWPVHPKVNDMSGVAVYKSLDDLPGAPDAAFIGINRHATIEAVKALNAMGAGGAVCFASGFAEAHAEDATGGDLQSALVKAAGDMPILGPNCYGFINALDGALLWPDQHGCTPVDRGVAILTQSSNIAINLTMQQRALPIAYMVTCGNMAQTTQAEIAEGLLEDTRVTAIGVHIEGFGKLPAWETFAQKAHERGIPVIALKVGMSDHAQKAAISHTASLAGSHAGAQAVLGRLGIARVQDLPTFLETLKLLHCNGALESNRLSSISCSGGEASLAADTAHGRDIVFPSLKNSQEQALTKALGPMVALANPLDYHTYVWRDAAAMSDVWSAMTDADIAMTLSIVDYPHTDASDWACATQAAIEARERSGRPFAVVATLSELMPHEVAKELLANGVTPMMGLTETIAAAEVAVRRSAPVAEPLLAAGADREGNVLTEAEAKSELARFGLNVPVSDIAESAVAVGRLASVMPEPLVLKGMGVAHKSDVGAVRIGLTAAEVEAAATDMPTDTFLIEEMINGGVAELLVGINRDPAHGFVLTLAAGGTMTEILADAVSLMVPTDDLAIKQALTKLKIYPLLTGFRGNPPANINAICAAVQAIQSYVIENADTVCEVEVNPLICTPARAVAADALIRKA
ncbi:MAG: acetate--CoA ligase family protein [Paracoccaceae bacterium]